MKVRAKFRICMKLFLLYIVLASGAAYYFHHVESVAEQAACGKVIKKFTILEQAKDLNMKTDEEVITKRDVQQTIDMTNGDTIEYVVTTKMNYINAEQMCHTLNMTLPVPLDAEENKFFTQLGGSFLALEVNLKCPNKPYHEQTTHT